jgi:hypothetical protein
LGAYTIPVTSLTTAQPKDQFKDGFVAVTDGDAAGSMGDMYQIKGHAAQAAAGLLTLDLYKPLKRAVTAGAAKADVLGNIYKNVILITAGFRLGVFVIHW